MPLRFKISHKLFAAFFLILLIVLSTMYMTKYLFSYNFRNYIHQVELEQLQTLVPLLQHEYEQQDGWQAIISDATHWEERLNIASKVYKVIPPPKTKKRYKRYKVLLSDANLNPVIGTPQPNDLVKLVPVQREGQIVGWLGLKKWEPLHSGPPAALIHKQTRQLFVLGLIMIGLTGLVAYLVSRQMVNPIRQLTKGTRELANRNFDVLVETGSRDEFAELAHHFNTMAQTLQRYEKMRQQWVTDISHELRTPLAVLRGEIEAIQDGIREASPENMASLHAEVARLSTLVEELHQLSMADTYGFNLKRIPCDLHELIKATLDGYQVALHKKGIAIQMETGQPHDLQAIVDPTRLKQVIGNILDNTCKYSKLNATLFVFTSQSDKTVHLCFADNGPGVTLEELDKIFDRLYRVDSSRNREFGGSGLGLSICKQIIEDHGGEIWAEQSDKGGLAIHIILPKQ